MHAVYKKCLVYNSVYGVLGYTLGIWSTKGYEKLIFLTGFCAVCGCLVYIYQTFFLLCICERKNFLWYIKWYKQELMYSWYTKTIEIFRNINLWYTKHCTKILVYERYASKKSFMRLHTNLFLLLWFDPPPLPQKPHSMQLESKSRGAMFNVNEEDNTFDL